MMRTLPEIAKVIGIDKARLDYHKRKDGFPDAEARKVGRRYVNYYDMDAVKAYWGKFIESN